MPRIPLAVRKDIEIAEGVADVERLLAPDVVYIRFNVREDWSGDPAVYFNVMLSDEAGNNRLIEVTELVEERLDERLDFETLGLYRYPHYRTQSEQAKLRDKEWA